MSKREQPLLLIGRPRTLSWQGEGAAILCTSAPEVEVTARSTSLGGDGVTLCPDSLFITDRIVVSSFSSLLPGCVIVCVSVNSGVELVTVTETEGVPGVVCGKEGTVT